MLGLAWLGALGMLAIELSYVPQIVRLARLKRADEVSLLFPALNLAGRLCALIYSINTGSSVFGIGFFVGASLRLTLLLQVAWYRRFRRSLSAMPAEVFR
jgi:uncharacterized protein with PQ loop repeat